MQFVLRSESPDVSVGDLRRLARALEINARHCAQSWYLTRPTIDAITGEPPRGCHVVAAVDGTNPPGSLAAHWYEPLKRVTYSRVWVEASSGFKSGRKSVCELFSHEILEAMVNPDLTRWFRVPRRDRFAEAAVEVADMVQTTTYGVEFGGEKWPMANFVTPAWFFDRPLARYDWSGELSAAGEIGPEGYAILRDDSRIWLEGPGGREKPFLNGELGKSKDHPWSRTRILLDGKLSHG